jgi:OmcA/MtrC family decaheme c-type cytochrome
MKSRHWKKIGIILLFLAVAAFALSGCGKGGDGAAGVAGPAGPAGPVTLTSESCIVCHNQSDVANVSRMHDYTFSTTTGSRTTPRYNESALTISAISVAQSLTNKPVITFTIKKGTANYVMAADALKTTQARFYFADQVPANTVTTKGTFGSPYWENWGYEAPSATNPLVSVGVGTGVYQFTFAGSFGVASSTSYNAADYNAAHVQRLYIRLGVDAISSPSADLGYRGAAGILDFNIPAAGAAATTGLGYASNQYVTVEACLKCHGAPFLGAAHASGYVDTLACVFCHSPLAGGSASASASAVYLPKFIHEIHAAIPVAEFPIRILGAGYKDVTYPQPINECGVCHTASGKALGLGDKTTNWKDNPTIEICGSCHETVNFATGVGHGPSNIGGIQTNTRVVGAVTLNNCSLCHPAASIVTYHAPAAATKDVPEYVATIAITAPANGTHYVKGEAPTVTVTLKDKTTGVAVPAALYTAASHAAGTTGSSLSKARLYVYGPRADAKPVLTKGAATLSAAGVPTQYVSLLLPSTDAQVLTDATGFKYKLTAIPEIAASATAAGFKSGTYMIRFIAQNYGYVSDTDYKIDTTAVKAIQIGSATVESRIAGNTTTDTCQDCHGARLFEPHNARHSVSFSANTTDECISCHDKSGNHAQALDLRVHAIHGASKTADLVAGETAALDWSKITYPQGIPTTVLPTSTSQVAFRDATTGLLPAGGVTGAGRCITCHSSTATSGTGILWKTTSVSQGSCKGCHNDKQGAVDHFLQNGGR